MATREPEDPITHDDVEYYQAVRDALPGFWMRLGGQPDLRGRRVLDLGCGHGSLCNEIGLAGAAWVVGVDLNPRLIDFARAYQAERHPELANRVTFRNCSVEDLEEGDFDYVVSRATFEHVIDMEGVLRALHDRMKPGGRLYTGFGPLYHSPRGDHGRTDSLVPWGHVLQTETMIVRRLNRRRNEPIRSIHDLGLNTLAPADYRRAFDQAGFRTVLYRENVTRPDASGFERATGRVLSILRGLPFLEKYTTVNIWCVLEKP